MEKLWNFISVLALAEYLAMELNFRQQHLLNQTFSDLAKFLRDRILNPLICKALRDGTVFVSLGNRAGGSVGDPGETVNNRVV